MDKNNFDSRKSTHSKLKAKGTLLRTWAFLSALLCRYSNFTSRQPSLSLSLLRPIRREKKRRKPYLSVEGGKERARITIFPSQPHMHFPVRAVIFFLLSAENWPTLSCAYERVHCWKRAIFHPPSLAQFFNRDPLSHPPYDNARSN